MKASKTVDSKEKDWTRPGVKLTHDEFIAGIRKAEEGPFYTFEEMQQIRLKWRAQKKKL
jgi:hypothetical protein